MSNVRRLPGPIADVWDWQRLGACRGRDSAQFFHPDGERGASRDRREAAAKAVCRTLPGARGVRRARARGPRALRRLGRLHRGRAAAAARDRLGGPGRPRDRPRSTSAGWRPGSARPHKSRCRPQRRPAAPAHGPADRDPLSRRSSRSMSRREDASSRVECPRRTRRPLLDGHLDAVPAGRAVGRRCGRLRVCVSPVVSVARTRRRVLARAWRPTARTTAARCRSTTVAASVGLLPRRRRRPAPRPCEMPRCCAQATPATIDRARPSGRCRPRGVSIRDCVLIGACARPAARHPVRVEVGEAGQLQLGEPLAWPTRSRTGRAPPSAPGSRARSAAARRSCRRRASRRGRRAAPRSACRQVQPSTDRLDHLVGAVERARASSSRSLSGYAEPARVADQVAADLVGDAGQRDVPLDHRPREQVVVA